MPFVRQHDIDHTQPHGRPRFRGETVTVCIAAACPGADDKMVLVTDRKMSGSWTSVDGISKLGLIESTVPWVSVMAGHTPDFGPTVQRIGAALNGVSYDDVVAACEAAHRATVTKRVEMEVLLNLGLTHEDFVKNGRQYFGPEIYLDYLGRIEKLDSRIDMLVAGFTDGRPRLFEVTKRGAITRHDQLLFAAIGSGADLALATLYPKPGLAYDDSLSRIIY